ncbi:MAG: FAD:protein FMN transferase [Muribaculaceae bacterium]|nr:FAD:protein FMN transferase [Muribaculaceae bacterium]
MNTGKSIFIWLLTLSAFSQLLACQHKGDYKTTEGMIWNTLYHITYNGPESLKDSILPTLNNVGKSLSVFDKGSLVSLLNESDSVQADHHLITVFKESEKIYSLSNGRFDPTLGPLIDAWGFGRGHNPRPDTLFVDSIMTFVGMDKTHLKGTVIIKYDPRVSFNFSAIAKGYGCDAVGEMLRRNNVFDYMVEIGGEISLRGKSPTGVDWKIGIDAPEEGKSPGEKTLMVLSLTDCGIATSGNYRNFHEEGGSKQVHTISSKTGRPFSSEILSATVISSSCMEADALATACMAGSLHDAMQLLESSGAEGMLVLADSTYFTPGFTKFIRE